MGGEFRFEQPSGTSTTVAVNNTAEVAFSGLLVNYGTMTCSGSQSIKFTGSTQAQLFNEAGGTLDLHAAQSFVRDSTLDPAVTTQIVNHGTMKVTPAAGTTTVGVDFNSDGTFVVQSGIASFTKAVQDQGATQVLATLKTANTWMMYGGSMSGTGTIDGNLDTTGGAAAVEPGVGGQPGVLTITGNYNHGTSATLVIDITSAGVYGQLKVQGLIALNGGNLRVNKDANYKPPLGTAPLNILVSLSGGIGDNFGNVTISNNFWTTNLKNLHFTGGFDSTGWIYQLTVEVTGPNAGGA